MSDSALTVTHVRNEIQKLLINYYTKTQIYPKNTTITTQEKLMD